MGNRWENSGNSVRLYFWGAPKITADGDCSHEIKRPLFLGRKAVTNLSVVASLSRVRCFVTLRIAASQASLSITNSRSSLRLMSIESVMPSSHLILCRPLLLLPWIPLRIRVFSNEPTLHMRCPCIGVSALASFLPKNTQDWSPLGWTGLISLQSKGFWRVFSNTIVQKHQFFQLNKEQKWYGPNRSRRY